MWSNRDVYIELVFIQVTTDIPPIQLVDWTFVFENLISFSRENFTSGTAIALCYVQIFTQGGFAVISSYSVFSQGETSIQYASITTSIRFNDV